MHEEMQGKSLLQYSYLGQSSFTISRHAQCTLWGCDHALHGTICEESVDCANGDNDVKRVKIVFGLLSKFPWTLQGAGVAIPLVGNALNYVPVPSAT
jgi:hypothetical protein